MSLVCIFSYRRKPMIAALLIAMTLALIARPAGAQTPDEHTSHHPAPSGAVDVAPKRVDAPAATSGAQTMTPNTPMSATGSPPPAAMPASGMGDMMGDMMSKMMAPKADAEGGCMGGNCGSAAATPIYPSLMTLPALTMEKRAEITALATQQIDLGTTQVTFGAQALKRATEAGNNLAMQQAVETMHEGLDALDAGIAARRVLSEGKAPRNLALDWFKREMNLASPIDREERYALFGVPPFHLFTMVLLIAFMLAMVAMYFFKMRRAAALFGRLDSGSPPPGASPPLGGSPVPPSPPPPLAASSPDNSSDTATPSETESSPEAISAARNTAASAVAPLNANWRGQLRVGSIITETPSVKTFRFLPSSGESVLPFTFVPGQFLNFSFWIGGARMNRSYSVSSSPTQRDYIDVTVRREPRGAVSRHIVDLLKVGSVIEAGGPVGRFTFSGEEAQSIVLIAGGVGITPMMSIVRYLSARAWSGDIYLIYACGTPTDYIFANDMAALQRLNPKLHLTVTMERAEENEWQGLRGRITPELLTSTIPDLPSRRIHLCGPIPMMDAVKSMLSDLHVPPEQVKTESFGTLMPKPRVVGAGSQPTSAATGPLVTFSKNNKAAKIAVEQTILELSEQLGIGIEFSCRVGTCGVCKVKMTSGEVEMAVEDALDPADKANNIILACQAKPKSAVAVDA